MLLLVSGASKNVDKYKYHPNLGQLLTPNTGNDPKRIHNNNVKWACDNACYTGFNEKKFLRMLEKIAPFKERLLFVTVPDVVADKEKTLELFKEWNPRIKEMGFPTALVIQDGMINEDIEWASIDAIFIGGTTEYKLGEEARKIVKTAKTRGKWVHMGRVNSYIRMDYAVSIGCDSVDGSKYSMFPDTYIPGALYKLENQFEQTKLEGCF